MYIPARTATRSIPITPTAAPSTAQSESSGLNVGAIAGGTVGGVVGLAGLIAVALLCLRSKRRQRALHSEPELDNSQRPELDAPPMARKAPTNYMVTEGNAMPSSVTPTPAYSPPPPPLSWQQVSPPAQPTEWTQQNTNTYGQYYYPQPPEPLQAPKNLRPYEITAELPGARSPASAELSDVSSPVNAETSSWRNPVLGRGDRGMRAVHPRECYTVGL
jgi:hypothetical protein